MIINEEFLNKIRQYFSLNLYEVKLWTAILSRGMSTAGELSDIADVPRSRTYDVLESLERKGFVIVKPEKPIKYIAIPPREVITRVHKKIEKDLEKFSKRLEKISNSDMMDELNELYNQGIEPMQITDFSGALKGRHNIYDQLSYIIKSAQYSVDIITSEDGIIRKLRSLRPIFEKAIYRGIKIRIISPKLNKSDLNFELNENIEVKNHPDIKSRFCIVDGKNVVFMLTDDMETHPSYDIGFWVNSTYFGNTLKNYFEHKWIENFNLNDEELND